VTNFETYGFEVSEDGVWSFPEVHRLALTAYGSWTFRKPFYNLKSNCIYLNWILGEPEEEQKMSYWDKTQELADWKNNFNKVIVLPTLLYLQQQFTPTRHPKFMGTIEIAPSVSKIAMLFTSVGGPRYDEVLDALETHGYLPITHPDHIAKWENRENILTPTEYTHLSSKYVKVVEPANKVDSGNLTFKDGSLYLGGMQLDDI